MYNIYACAHHVFGKKKFTSYLAAYYFNGRKCSNVKMIIILKKNPDLERKPSDLKYNITSGMLLNAHTRVKYQKI